MGPRKRATIEWLLAAMAIAALAGCDTTGLIYGPACSGHGAEESAGGSSTCSCFDGYTGSWCESCAAGYQDNDDNGTCSPSCDALSLACGARQYCDDTDGSAECICELGYAGADCTECASDYQDNDGDSVCEPSCAHAELGCNDHGTCNDSSGTVVCQCDAGYQGENCNDCVGNYQDNDHDGTCEPSCASQTLDCGHGACDDSSGQVTCSCDEEYTGQYCDDCAPGYQDNDHDGSCLETCATAAYTCSGIGVCADTSGVAKCDCNDGYHDDGAGNCISASFIVTLVNDGLDPTDGEMMRAGLTDLGYAEEVWDRDVSSSELTSYLQTNVTLLYHTGHGNTGAVMTSSGSINTGSATIAVENTIFATCLTLSDTGWKNAFGPTAKNVMGYTEVSYDGPDDDIVESYLDELGNGRSHLQSWYLSNSASSWLGDRWCAYSREGSSIVEYSARSGNNPATQTSGQLVPLPGAPDLRIAPALLTAEVDANVSFVPIAIAGSTERRSFAEAGELNDWLTPTSLSEADAVLVAERYLGVDLPTDSYLDEVVDIESAPADEYGPPAVVGYSIRFAREVAGLPVRGMRVADSITVLVASGQVVAVTSYWPDLAVSKQSLPWRDDLLSPGQAIELAAPAISRILKAGVKLDIVQARPVYGTLGPYASATELVPAYDLASASGEHFIVDAATGALLM